MNTLLRLVPLVAVCSVLAGCGPDPSVLLERARAELAAEDDAAARLDLLEVLKARPGDAAALALLARVQVRLGDGEGAIATLQRLDAAGHRPEPDRPTLQRLRAEAEVLRGRPDAALAALGDDGSAAAWRIRAAAALARKDTAGAVTAYERGLQAGPDAALAVAYARLLLTGEDYAAAARLLDLARRQAPRQFDVLLLDADLLAAQGRADAAEAAYRAAAAAAPRRAEPLLGLAALADAAGREATVEQLVTQAATLAPDHPAVRQWQLQVAQMKGDWDQVRTMLAPREASLEPASADSLAYAEALLNLGQPEQARAVFRRALSASPQNPYARLMLAEAQLATGDARAALDTVRPLADAIAADDRALDLAERAARAAGSPEAGAYAQRRHSAALVENRRLLAQGAAAYARGQWAAASAAFAALNARGEDADVLRRLSLAASKAGQHEAAIVAAERARALRPDDPDMAYAAGLARLAAGRDPARGLADLVAASRAEPDNPLFRAAVAQARLKAGQGR